MVAYPHATTLVRFYRTLTSEGVEHVKLIRTASRLLGVLALAVVLSLTDFVSHYAQATGSSTQHPQPATLTAKAEPVTTKIVINQPANGPLRETEFFKPFGHPRTMVPHCPHSWCGGARFDRDPAQVVIIPAPKALFVSGEADYHCGPNGYLTIRRLSNGHPTIPDSYGSDQGTCTWYHIVVRYHK
ncbi:MAG TPA: hypothetical protein VFH39_01765 [Candidatus Saccharimonadales bacterium]|nr:hypothetical protein [Candidatus Saccharimonadales bacterium]